MSHRIPATVVACVVIFGASPVLQARTPSTSGRLHGLVRDIAGIAIADASVLAVGQTIITARSDVRGRFQMALPAGDYVLKATRNGYVSTYREPVRVVSSTLLERTITLTRQNATVVPASLDSHSHTDLAWQLRHLTRSILRDEGGTAVADVAQAPTPLRPDAGFVADLTGQVNFVTTASTRFLPATHVNALPRGIAFIVLGAPVGASGDWRMRGAIASGSASSWNLLGEYSSRALDGHAASIGVSYSAQDYQARSTGRLAAGVIETRSVAGIFGRDRWLLSPRVDVRYALRADRYDYLNQPNLYSGSAGVRARFLSRTFVEGDVARSMIAPGADEFLPPPAEGPWLPPERTFSSFSRAETLRAEDVRHSGIGISREYGRDTASGTIRVRAFRQETLGQLATLFGAPIAGTLGHYRVARAGHVRLDGWAVGVTGSLFGHVTGQVEYSRVSADWRPTGRSRGLRRAEPSVVRPEVEQLHDLLASMEASFHDARTRLQLVYRSSNGFTPDEQFLTPLPGGRFDFQVHQALPYRPVRNGRLELLFAIRTLFRDIRQDGSVYDELLTIRPPMRFMGGIQMRF